MAFITDFHPSEAYPTDNVAGYHSCNFILMILKIHWTSFFAVFRADEKFIISASAPTSPRDNSINRLYLDPAICFPFPIFPRQFQKWFLASRRDGNCRRFAWPGPSHAASQYFVCFKSQTRAGSPTLPSAWKWWLCIDAMPLSCALVMIS